MNSKTKEIPESQVWLITGSSRGLGRALADAVLGAGHKLVATARNPAQLSDLTHATVIELAPSLSTLLMRERQRGP
jgi:NAD(P)-dependent dehydrogenase (short-subunit alcohol dehydrogenase family)